MGEAKTRGSFEQRKTEAIKRNKLEKVKRLEKLAEIERNKTPEQKQKEIEARMMYGELMAMSAPYLPYILKLNRY